MIIEYEKRNGKYVPILSGDDTSAKTGIISPKERENHRSNGIEKIVEYFRNKNWFLTPLEIAGFSPEWRNDTFEDFVGRGNFSRPAVNYDLDAINKNITGLREFASEDLETYIRQNQALVGSNFKRGIWAGFLMNPYECENVIVTIPKGDKKEVYITSKKGNSFSVEKENGTLLQKTKTGLLRDGIPFTQVHLTPHFGDNFKAGDYMSLAFNYQDPLHCEEVDLQRALHGINYGLLRNIENAGGKADFSRLLARALNIGAYIEGVRKGLQAASSQLDGQSLSLGEILTYLHPIKEVPRYLG